MVFRLDLARPVRSHESIFTQTDNTGEMLESFISDIFQNIESGRYTNSRAVDGDHAIPKLEKYIFDRFGLKVHFIVDSLTAAILPFYSNVNHIAIPEFLRGTYTLRDQSRLLKSFNGRKGSVDLKNAKVSGIFSEYDHPLYMNFFELKNTFNCSVGEVTAGLFHELGHGYNACYLADRLDETNQVLASVSRNLIETGTGDFEYIFKELKKINEEEASTLADAIVNGERVVAGATLFKFAVKTVRSQMLGSLYNRTSFEQISDNFASRFGYGEELVSCLDKMHRLTPEKNLAIFFLAQFTQAFVTIVLFSFILFAITGTSMLAVLVTICYNLIWYLVSREDCQDYTYDKLKVRYLRIRQDAIGQLKDRDVDKKTAERILEMIKTIDIAISGTKDVKYLPNIVANFLFPAAGRAASSIDNQQLMEMLASNDVFLKAKEIGLKA